MLTAEGCRQRRMRLLDRMRSSGIERLALADPVHLCYLAAADFDPIGLSADLPAVLLIERDGQATLVLDRRSPDSALSAHVDEIVQTDWYPGDAPACCPRQLSLDTKLRELGVIRLHDQFGDPLRREIVTTIAELRRAKDLDELAAIRACIAAGETGHVWANSHIEAGMTELDVYAGVQAACERVAGKPVIVYGDFAVSPGPERMGGPPTTRTLANGDLFILDFSVVIGGYRGDFTNTLAVGHQPTPKQQTLFNSCLRAMQTGEATLRAGAKCQQVYDAVLRSFKADGVAGHFPHHAGHGLGLTHPEAPYFVRQSTETLVAGDVVTLEPGLYVPSVGGMRIERNYLVTSTGFELLTRHGIELV